MTDVAKKDTWVDDPNRPGVQVLVAEGDPLPVKAELAGVSDAAKTVKDPLERPGVEVVEGASDEPVDQAAGKAVTVAENKATSAPAKKKG